jgi:hypothetical protein
MYEDRDDSSRRWSSRFFRIVSKFLPNYRRREKFKNLYFRIISLTNFNAQFSAESALNRFTVQPFTESDDTRCCVNAIFPPGDVHVNARNMSRVIV